MEQAPHVHRREPGGPAEGGEQPRLVDHRELEGAGVEGAPEARLAVEDRAHVPLGRDALGAQDLKEHGARHGLRHLEGDVVVTALVVEARRGRPEVVAAATTAAAPAPAPAAASGLVEELDRLGDDLGCFGPIRQSKLFETGEFD